MLIGTSLGRCMYSILSGEVDGGQVGIIITRTRAETYENLLEVVREYYNYGNGGARISGEYELGKFKWEDVEQLAHNLWHGGRIHQPRNFSDPYTSSPLMPEMSGVVWMEVVPTNTSTNPSVVAAYEQYQVLKALAQ